MGKRYGIQFYAPQGVSSEAEPSAKQVASIIRHGAEQTLKPFVQYIADTRMLEKIAKETGSKIMETLFRCFKAAAQQANTYVNMYRYNVDALTKAMK